VRYALSMATFERARGMAFAPEHSWFALEAPAVVSLTFPPDTSDGNVAEAFASLTAWMERVDRPYMFLIRADRVLSLTATQRRLMAEAEQGYAHIERRFNAGQAVVIQSVVQRGIFTAFTWISPPVWPYEITASAADAFAWLDRQWEEVTVDYPDGPVWTGRLRR